MKPRFLFIWMLTVLLASSAVGVFAQEVPPVIPQDPRPDGSLVHVVQVGDSIDGILFAYANYGLTLDLLLTRNGWRFPPQFIFVGQEIVILPAGGAPVAQPTAPPSQPTQGAGAPIQPPLTTNPLPATPQAGEPPLLNAGAIQALSPVEGIAPFINNGAAQPTAIPLPSETPTPTPTVAETATLAATPSPIPTATATLEPVTPEPISTEEAFLPTEEVVLATEEAVVPEDFQAALQDLYQGALGGEVTQATTEEPVIEATEEAPVVESTETAPVEVASVDVSAAVESADYPVALQGLYQYGLVTGATSPAQPTNVAIQSSVTPTIISITNTLPPIATTPPPTVAFVPPTATLAGEVAANPTVGSEGGASSTPSSEVVASPSAAEGAALSATAIPVPTQVSVAEIEATTGTVCLWLFEDKNQNTFQDPDESILDGGSFTLGEGTSQTRAGTDPLCLSEQAAGFIQASVVAPDGYGITTSQTLQVLVVAGRTVQVSFGAAAGFTPPQIPVEATLDAPSVEVLPTATVTNSEENETILDTLWSYVGLVVIGLAILLFLGGLGLVGIWRLFRR